MNGHRIRFASRPAGAWLATLFLPDSHPGPPSEQPAMETRRLPTLVDATQTLVLLVDYIYLAARATIPTGARQQTDVAKLPLAFQDRVEHAEAQGMAWSAWIHGGDAWLFVGELNLNNARERGQPVLEIEVYDYERHTKSRSVVLRSPDGSWQKLESAG